VKSASLRPDSFPACTFVLIPGAGADPLVYAATIQELEALGHAAIAPPLPLNDPSARPSDHAAAVVSAVPRGADVVVVGQSLGAFTGPLVAAAAPVSQLILLAPMIPRPGETAGEWWGNTRHEDAITEILERHGPMGTWGPDAFAEVFLHDVDPAVARAHQHLTGAPGEGMFAEPWPLRVWPDVRTRVLVPSGDRLFPPAFQRRVARERLGLEIDEMVGDHLPMLARPRELAERLVELTLLANR
jgi:Alpha/beta hydrolase family